MHLVVSKDSITSSTPKAGEENIIVSVKSEANVKTFLFSADVAFFIVSLLSTTAEHLIPKVEINGRTVIVRLLNINGLCRPGDFQADVTFKTEPVRAFTFTDAQAKINQTAVKVESTAASVSQGAAAVQQAAVSVITSTSQAATSTVVQPLAVQRSTPTVVQKPSFIPAKVPTTPKVQPSTSTTPSSVQPVQQPKVQQSSSPSVVQPAKVEQPAKVTVTTTQQPSASVVTTVRSASSTPASVKAATPAPLPLPSTSSMSKEDKLRKIAEMRSGSRAPGKHDKAKTKDVSFKGEDMVANHAQGCEHADTNGNADHSPVFDGKDSCKSLSKRKVRI